jgi:hypothetical protein
VAVVLSSSPATGAAAVTGKLVPPSGALLGAFVNHSTPSGSKTEITQLESALGRKLAIDHRYYQWSTKFPTPLDNWDFSQGRIPFVTWHGYDTYKINNGSQDAWIRSVADAVDASGKLFFLSWFAEMDNHFNDPLTHTPSAFIKAWRHVHDIFVARGATNAVWVWCPTGWAFETGEAPTYYPGASYVDWVGSDAFNWYPGKPGSKWRTLKDISTSAYNWAKGTNKPMMIGETGTQEWKTGDKAKWILDAATALKTSFPNIKAFVYYDTNNRYNWRVQTSTASFNAFKSMGADSYFSP